MSEAGMKLVEFDCELDTKQVAALDELARSTGKSRESLIDEAVRWFVADLELHLQLLSPRKP